MTTTKDVGYWEPMHYRIEFRERKAGGISYGFFDSEDTNPSIKVHHAVLKLNTIMHSFEFEVDNSDDSVNPDWIKRGNRLKLQVWKNGTYGSSSYIFIGLIDYPNERRYGYLGHKFKVVAYELKQIVYDANVTFIRNAPLDELGKVDTNNAVKYKIYRLIKDLFSSRQYTLLRDDAIKDRIPGIDSSFPGVSDTVDIIFPKPRIRNQSAGTGIDEWAELIGFNWYFDYTGGTPNLIVRWPSEENQKIIMKAGDTKDINNDDVLYTSYITKDFEKTSSTSQEGNFANVISAISKIENLIMAQRIINSTSTFMGYKAISMPFQTNETDFTELDLMLSKQGDPHSPLERVNGAIFVNVSNKPVGKVLDFEIPLSDIEEQPTMITVDLTERKRFMKNLGAGQTSFFITMYQRSNGNTADGQPDGNGNPNKNTQHGYRWHRDTAKNGGSLIAENGDRDAHKSLVWKTHGPNYVFVLRSSVNRLFVSTNQESVQELGKKEPQSLDFGFIEDVNTAQRYNSSILYYASLYKVPVPLKVTVPNDFLFKPYQVIPAVTVNKIFPAGIDLEIQEVEYNFSENNNECSIICLATIDENFPTTFGCTPLVS